MSQVPAPAATQSATSSEAIPPTGTTSSATSETPVETPSAEPAVDPTKTQATKIEDSAAPTTPPAEEKPADAGANPPAEEGADEYDLELPENSVLSEDDLDEVVKLAEKYNLDEEDSKALLEKKEALVKRGIERAQAYIDDLHNKDLAKLKADPMFSTPEAEKQSLEFINMAYEKFGTPEMLDFLKTSAGSNLALAKFMRAVGEKIAPEGASGIGGGNPPGNSGDSEVTQRLKNLYPTMFKNS